MDPSVIKIKHLNIVIRRRVPKQLLLFSIRPDSSNVSKRKKEVRISEHT